MYINVIEDIRSFITHTVSTQDKIHKDIWGTIHLFLKTGRSDF